MRGPGVGSGFPPATEGRSEWSLTPRRVLVDKRVVLVSNRNLVVDIVRTLIG